MLTTEEENIFIDKCLVLQARRNSMSSIKYYIHEIFNKELRKFFFFLDSTWIQTGGARGLGIY